MFIPYGISGIRDTVSSYELAVREYKDALVFPTPKAIIWPKTQAGVCESSGCPIRESGLERSYGEVTEAPNLDGGKQPVYSDEEVIFGGYLMDHFGHFILESLARMWAVGLSGPKVVWASGRKLNSYQAQIFEFLGFSSDRHIFISQPTAFRRLWVPTPGYIIRQWFHEKHVSYLGRTESIGGSDKIYLSRSKFSSKVANISGEDVLEETLRSDGWAVIYPELLSFQEQVDILAGAGCVAGIEGSAFHGLMFLKNIKAKIAMIRRPKGNLNFDTAALAKSFLQVNFLGHLEDCSRTEGRGSMRLVDPEKTASELIERMRISSCR